MIDIENYLSSNSPAYNYVGARLEVLVVSMITVKIDTYVFSLNSVTFMK